MNDIKKFSKKMETLERNIKLKINRIETKLRKTGIRIYWITPYLLNRLEILLELEKQHDMAQNIRLGIKHKVKNITYK